MHKRLLTIFLLLLIATAGSNAAELKVPKHTSRIVDKAGIISLDDKSKIEMSILQFERATSGQIAVLIIPSLKGDSLEMFSMRVAEKWKLGSKDRDDGILLLISVKDHKIRLEVGYGFEGKLNDARAGDIIRGMQPFFRANRYGDGIMFAVMRSQEFITGKKATTPLPRARTSSGITPGVVKMIIFITIYFVILFGNRRRRGFTLLSGGYYGGYSGRSSGGFGGGGFSGGGGSFGGGGASGGW